MTNVEIEVPKSGGERRDCLCTCINHRLFAQNQNVDVRVGV